MPSSVNRTTSQVLGLPIENKMIWSYKGSHAWRFSSTEFFSLAFEQADGNELIVVDQNVADVN